jgi:hypothetical protein
VRAKANPRPDRQGAAQDTAWTNAGKSHETPHSLFPSMVCARRLGLIGSTLEISAKESVRRRTAPTGSRTTEWIKRGLSLRNRLQNASSAMELEATRSEH